MQLLLQLEDRKEYQLHFNFWKGVNNEKVRDMQYQ